ncbi:hypothetical protein [Nakamurella sp.]|uniref:hypothetical protein n=1 Tax=Nakamurella sp. TaxID=1869182 RepID=UPI0037851D69
MRSIREIIGRAAERRVRAAIAPVAGSVTSPHATAGRRAMLGGRIRTRRTGSGGRRAAPADPAGRRRPRPVLSDALDIEWAWAQRRVWLLQCRPVTA